MNQIKLEQNQKTIAELTAQLSEAMKDQQHILELWPNAPVDSGLFTHLEMTFDLHENKVITETSAKDIHGEPYFKYILDTA